MADLILWFRDNTDVVVHESVKICTSAVNAPSSGYGLFVEMTSDHVGAETLELLRIPKKHTFDIHTLLELLFDGKQYSSNNEFQKTNHMVKSVIGALVDFEGMDGLLSESTILVCYLLLCTITREKYEFPRVLCYYLENVLLKTYVCFTPEYLDLLLKYHGQYLDSQLLNQTLKILKRFFEKELPEFKLSSAVLYQVYAAVKSRCLEIPQELDERSEDYVVNSTMVPLLDFCNHSSNPNACFDVDRKTGEVMLLLDLKKCNPNALQEVFISYAQSPELFSFFNAYGFVPPAQEFQFFNLSIERNFLFTQPVDRSNLRVFYKWLHINPVIQLLKHDGVWYINDTIEDFAFLTLAFLPDPDDLSKSCWQYDDRSYETFAYFQDQLDSPNFESQAELLKFYKDDITSRQMECKDYVELPQLAWNMRFKDDAKMLRRRVTKEQALDLALFEDPRRFAHIIDRFKACLLNYLDYRQKRLAVSTPNLSFNQLTQLEAGILQDLRNEIQQDQIMFWSDIDLEAPEILLPPLLSSIATNEEKDGPQENDLHFDLLGLSSYDPHKHTDFLQEEMDQFSQFCK